VYFTRPAVIQRVALEYVGAMSVSDVEEAVDALLASKRFVALDKTDDHGQALYTSQRQVNRELWINERMLDKAAALVAFTRSKQAFRFYTGQMDLKGPGKLFPANG